MLSKPAIFAAGIALVRGDAKMVDPAPTYVEGDHKSYGCARCIRNGFSYVSQYYGRTDMADNAADIGVCCPADNSACDGDYSSFKNSISMGSDVALS